MVPITRQKNLSPQDADNLSKRSSHDRDDKPNTDC